MKRYTAAERAAYRTSAAALLASADDAERAGQHGGARVARKAARRHLARVETRGWFRRPIAV